MHRLQPIAKPRQKRRFRKNKNEKKVRGTRNETSLEDYYARVLSALYEFMYSGGLSRTEVERLTAASLAHAEKSKELPQSGLQISLRYAAQILDAWHRVPPYVDDDAVPQAIPLQGGTPSVEALIRAECPDSDPALFTKEMRKLGLIVKHRRNRYRPIGRAALVSTLDTSVQEHVARSLSLLLDTVKRNVVHSNGKSRLIERFAEVPDLRAGEVSAFEQFVEEQGTVFLQTINEWLEQRRASRMPSDTDKGTVAGLHVYAYLGHKRR
jgi:hypothetical protein